MNRSSSYLSAHWELSLFLLLLLALLGGMAGWHFMLHPQQEIIPPIKERPNPPSLIPWEDLQESQQPTFMHPVINAKIRNPFWISFVLPAPPAPPPPPAVSPSPEEQSSQLPPPPPPPPPPPHTCELTYTGVYHSLLGKTVAYLKCVDSVTGETTVNLTPGEEILPAFKIHEITDEAVLITVPPSSEGDYPSLLRLPLRATITLTLPPVEEAAAAPAE